MNKMVFKKILIYCFLVCLFSCKDAVIQSKDKNQKPNIVLIVVDDQGYADFEAFDNHDPKVVNPHIAKLAHSGITFTQAYTTAPVCSPSRVGMLTGKNQFRWDKKASWGPGLPDKVKTMAEYLKEVGYTTARIGKNDLGDLDWQSLIKMTKDFFTNNLDSYYAIEQELLGGKRLMRLTWNENDWQFPSKKNWNSDLKKQEGIAYEKVHGFGHDRLLESCRK